MALAAKPANHSMKSTWPDYTVFATHTSCSEAFKGMFDKPLAAATRKRIAMRANDQPGWPDSKS
jgi:hypothetical protein